MILITEYNATYSSAENIVPVLINCDEINVQTAIRYYLKAVKQEGNKNCRLFSIPLKIP